MLERHGITTKDLFGKGAMALLFNKPDQSTVATDVSQKEEVVDLSANSQDKKKKRGPAGALRTDNCYTTTTTAKFAITPTVHLYKNPHTFVEGAIKLTLEDKPKELILSFKLILKNGQYLDSNFGLTPPKKVKGTKSKVILKEDDVPTNFTHLGQYMGTSGRQIFEPKKMWKENNKAKPHRVDAAAENKNTKEYPIVYFTFAFATDLDPRNLIDGIRNEWETHDGGKLMVKDLQSHKSKVAFVLYFVCTGTPHNYILRTLCSILQEAAELQLEGTMITEVDGEEHPITIIPEISIKDQVPSLKGVDTKDFDKLPWHVKENRKALQVDAKSDDIQELKDLV